MPNEGATEAGAQANRSLAITSSKHVAPIVRSLQARLAADIDENVIAAEVEAELAVYSSARITQFVPILAESRVWERLRERSA